MEKEKEFYLFTDSDLALQVRAGDSDTPFGPNGPGSEGEEDTGIALAEETKVRPPKMYKVLLHNDDYTTMEFVVHILVRFFRKSQPEAQSIMLSVHENGVGVCGIFTYEVAESKTAKVIRYARSQGHPLKCSFEPCDSEN